MTLQEAFTNSSLEKIKEIPKKIAELVFVDSSRYKSLVGSKLPEEIIEKGDIDKLLGKLRSDFNVIGHVDKDNFRIYVKKVNWESKVTERKIIEFLRGESKNV